MNDNLVLKCSGCGANLEFSDGRQSSIQCTFCNAITVVPGEAREDSEPSPPSREEVMTHLQSLHRVAGVLFAVAFGIFFVKVFGMAFGVMAAAVFWALDLALVSADSRVGKVRMAPAESLLIYAIGTHWKPRLLATELGTCVHCGFRLAEPGGVCSKSLSKTHYVLEITSTGDIDLGLLESVPLVQDKSVWFMAAAVLFCWAIA